MDESRIKVGTKIKILNYGFTEYTGKVAFICNDSSFHRNNNVKDKDGMYWAKPIKIGSYSKICLASTECFKILKY